MDRPRVEYSDRQEPGQSALRRPVLLAAAILACSGTPSEAQDVYGPAAWRILKTLEDCNDPGDKLLYDLATRNFSCGTDVAGSGDVDFSDLTGVADDAQIPAGIARDSEVATGYQPLATSLTRLAANCTIENDSTPIPDSCVGNGTDDTGGGGGIGYAEVAAAVLAGF